jgi:dTDP-4-dehydrorhamnose reductase
MSAAGQTTWCDFAHAILEEAEAAPRDLAWLAVATKGRRLIARRVIPISTAEFHAAACRPSYSVLSNSRLVQTFGIELRDWQSQLRGCFVSDRAAATIAAGCGLN